MRFEDMLSSFDRACDKSNIFKHKSKRRHGIDSSSHSGQVSLQDFFVIFFQDGLPPTKQVAMRTRDLQAATRLAKMAVSRSSTSTKLGWSASMASSTCTVDIQKRQKRNLIGY